MFSSEKKSLYRFLAIYLTSTFLLFSLASWIFYISVKHNLLEQQRDRIKYEAERIKKDLRTLHKSNAEKLLYPQSDIVDSGIYDLDTAYIFGTFEHPQTLENQKEKDRLYYVSKLDPYYLGAAYLLVRKDIDFTPIHNLQKNILLFMLIAGLFFSLLGLFLGRLFIAPMRESIKKMNHFIQDTTHELNTPISTILTNIEMIESLGGTENHKELKRIEIASKTLSRIYDDLTYLNLNHQYHRNIVTLDMSTLLHERILYFSTMAEAKALRLELDIKDKVILELDKNDALRLIDNLISNAIKYNKTNGFLKITLNEILFSVEDSGVGIMRTNLGTITQRFKRANKSEGGFGIGLDIVNQVVQYYHFILKINSQEQKGTEVIITWQK